MYTFLLDEQQYFILTIQEMDSESQYTYVFMYVEM